MPLIHRFGDGSSSRTCRRALVMYWKECLVNYAFEKAVKGCRTPVGSYCRGACPNFWFMRRRYLCLIIHATIIVSNEIAILLDNLSPSSKNSRYTVHNFESKLCVANDPDKIKDETRDELALTDVLSVIFCWRKGFCNRFVFGWQAPDRISHCSLNCLNTSLCLHCFLISRLPERWAIWRDDANLIRDTFISRTKRQSTGRKREKNIVK